MVQQKREQVKAANVGNNRSDAEALSNFVVLIHSNIVLQPFYNCPLAGRCQAVLSEFKRKKIKK